MVFQTMKAHNADYQKEHKILNPSQSFSIPTLCAAVQHCSLKTASWLME